jgi:hypothetical protein
LLDAQEVRTDVLVTDDVHAERTARVLVPAHVVAVMVAVQQVSHRKGADRLHLRDDVAHHLRILVVDDDQPFGRHANGDVARLVNQAVVGTIRTAATSAAGHERSPNHEQAVLDLLRSHRPCRQALDLLLERKLLRQHGSGERHQQRGDDTRDSHTAAEKIRPHLAKQ